MNEFQQQILQGIPKELPPKQPLDLAVSHAPARKPILTLPPVDTKIVRVEFSEAERAIYEQQSNMVGTIAPARPSR